MSQVVSKPQVPTFFHDAERTCRIYKCDTDCIFRSTTTTFIIKISRKQHTMRSIRVFLLCALAAVTISAVVGNNSSGPEECCFRHYPRKLSPKIFESYFMTDGRCPLMGVILVTKKKNHICANPSLSWVKKVMKSLDESIL